ncbi:hypothetical protein RUM44_005277 [Polyplax serrata]|uniref:Uncharacterized protein n=1 Tax=Polyplax serrata TaxID=468196 RepID=A0ABR1AEL6_POLSC
MFPGDTCLEPKLCGRGKILAFIKEAKSQFNSSMGNTPVPSKPGIGRGNFLAQISKQKELQATRGWIPNETHREIEIKPPQCDNLENKFEDLVINDSLPLVTRGECGEQINVMTNYIKLQVDPAKSVYEYFVKFEPDIDFSAFRFKLINQNFKSRKGIKCYDGGTQLYLPEVLTKDELIVNTTHPNDNSPVRIIVTLKKKMTLKECGALYNILFKNCAKVLKFARLGRETYDFRQSYHIPQHKLEVWPGYVTSVQESDGGLLLSCDIKHRVLRSETAYEVLTTISKLNPQNFRAATAKELLGQCVLTRYNNNLYRIDDIDWNQTPLSTFKLSSGNEISFLEYYKTQYNIDIKDLKQPLLLSKEKRKGKVDVTQLICLVPEICHMTGLTDKMRNDFHVMKDIATYTRITPIQRNYSFKKFMNNIKSNEHAQEMLAEWGLTIADEPLEITARILPTENLHVGNKISVPVPDNKAWGNILKNQGLLRSVDLKNWVLIYTRKDSLLANKFQQAVKRISVGLGMDVLEPKMVPLQNDRIQSYLEGLKHNVNCETQLVVCLCPTARTDRYSAIKKFCCREVPVQSQVVNCSTINRENRMIPVVQNIVIQINNKLGGASWTLRIPLKNCMICGIDTFHQRGSNSVGAFVASIDAEYTRWFSRTCIQQPHQELLDGLVCCFIAGLKKYLTLNHTLPDRIVIFRDGVGDGMLSYVQNHEIQQFLDACRLVGKDYKPKLSFVVVSKRINTKFYKLLVGNINCVDDNGGTLENPNSGAIVDHTITKRNLYDFFIVAQHVTCGTATPSHYIVLYDTSDLKPDHMQRLTYKFCHMYFNWAGTVRVPAPCLYAHKLAYLVGLNLKGPASEVLEDKLFYL